MTIIKQKHRMKQLHKNLILNKLTTLFEYENLPETVPAWHLEKLLLTNGYAIFTKHKGNFYATVGNPTGTPNHYGLHDMFLLHSIDVKLQMTGVRRVNNVNCIKISNDFMECGIGLLLETFSDFATESDITLHQSIITMRQHNVISANDSDEIDNINNMYKNLLAGNLTSLNKKVWSDVEMLKLNEHDTDFTKLLELVKYKRSEIFNELGVQINDNNKRSYVNSDELEDQEQAVYYFIDNMFQSRKEAIKRINKMYDLNITVKISPLWQPQTKEEPGEQKETLKQKLLGGKANDDK